MDLLTRDSLKTLIAKRASPAISIYLPTHRGGSDIQQDPIRLKNLIRAALESPGAQAYRPAELAGLTAPMQALTGDTAFWHEQGDGLALFCAPDFLHTFRAPQAFSELAVVADRFHVKPLLPLLMGAGRFWLLALSQKSVRLYQVSRDGMVQTSLGDAPTSLTEALRYDETGRELRSRQRSNRGASGAEQLYHGKGHDQTDQKEQLTRFFREIDAAVAGVIRLDRAPLVLAGVEFEIALYRSVNSCGGLLDVAVPGHPEGWSNGQLREKAWAVMEPHFQKERRAAEDKFRELAGTGSATNDLGAVLPAAHEGRVESLFVAVGVQRWGRFDAITYLTHQHDTQLEGDEDLLDLAAIQTLLHHGRVYAVQPGEVPRDGPGASLAAVFRY